jgi:hypothetical protein
MDVSSTVGDAWEILANVGATHHHVTASKRVCARRDERYS